MNVTKKNLITVIGLFYVISGFWEFLLGLTQAESISAGVYNALDFYRIYLIILGIFTFFIGIGFLLKIELFKKLALILAWWNLLTVPLIQVWWSLYSIYIAKFSKIYSPFIFWIYTIALLLIITFVRVYVIKGIRMSKGVSVSPRFK